MHISLLSCGKVKTPDAQTCVFAFLKTMLYRHIGYTIYFLSGRMDGGDVVDVTSCSFHHAWQFTDHD